MAESIRAAICAELIALARQDLDIVVLCSDSRGSASMGEFAKSFPERFIETGIAEQNLVAIAAGLAHGGKKPFVASPACFLSARALEQVKVDVAYSNMPVMLIGISGGFSYGPLGMTHHSLSDVATLRPLPNMTVLLPADRFEAVAMVRELVNVPRPAYIRIGRNPVPDVHEKSDMTIGKVIWMRREPNAKGTIIACGECVAMAMEAATLLRTWNVLNVHTLKPLDEKAIQQAAQTGRIVTVEEHHIINGLGAAVLQTLALSPVPVLQLGVPDEPAVAGDSAYVRMRYGLDGVGIARQIVQWEG